MLNIILKYWIEIIMTFISSTIIYIINQYKGLKNGMKSLLKNEIVRVYETYIKLGYCPSFIKDNITDIYNSYHKLGGNGMTTSMLNEIYKLPNELKK